MFVGASQITDQQKINSCDMQVTQSNTWTGSCIVNMGMHH